MNRRATRRDCGTTLIEMMVVISIILIFLAAAVPIYSHSVTRAREENLRHNLETLNQLIFQYALDKQKCPQSLDDLRSAGYIKEIPEDITNSVDTWQTESCEGVILSLDQTDSSGGILGVHSGSNQVGSDGKPYSEW
ncbi:MAG: type II secretion system GspH family protein [Acidobacteriia bacterium]|nr:type II secretion system GspH family protein [Terriglobia bacterium]